MGRRKTRSTRSTPPDPTSLYTDAQGRTDAETYLRGIADGTIVAGKRMKKLAAMMLPRIREGYKGWHFSAEHATRPVYFIEHFCCYPAGRMMGKPFVLEPYERMIVELTFGFVDDRGMRQFQYLFVEMARKNGKTSLVASMELYMLLSDGEGAPQVYNAAVTGKQAALGFGAALHMRRKSPHIKSHVAEGSVKERDNQTGLICEANLGYIITLSGDSKSLDGLDISCAVLDELAAWKSREVFDLIMQSIGARDQPLVISISTQGFVRDSIWDDELENARGWVDGKVDNDRMLAILFEQDSREETFIEDAWPKSNPGLGTVKKWQYMRDQAQKARNQPSYMPTFLTKDLNIAANQAASFMTIEECVNEETFDFDPGKFRYAVLGFDAADFIDLTAARALFMRPDDNHIYERSMYWVPEEQVERGNRNGVGNRDSVPYQLWDAQGLIRIVQGNVVPRTVLIDWVQELYDDGLYPYAIGYDPWHVEQPIQEQLRQYMGEANVIKVRQGVQTLSNPMKQLRADMRSNRIVDGHNPINEWCRMNVAAKTDINGNVQPVKVSDAHHRIDGFMAELDAYVVLLQKWDDYQAVIRM